MEKEGEKALGKLQVKESKGKGWGEKGELLLNSITSGVNGSFFALLSENQTWGMMLTVVSLVENQKGS